MIAPARYIRKAYKTALTGIVPIFDGFAPEDAVVPYGVITSIESVQTGFKCIQWTCTVTIALYIEFQEFGGTAVVDGLSDSVIGVIGADGSSYLSIENFSSFGAKVLSISNDVAEINSLKVFRVIIRNEHNLST
jgi:hypothetical protein